MTKDPISLIEDFLDRVKVYLPMGSEDTLLEIRTHLIEEAERIGEGSITEGSVTLAIEHLGEPKRVASEYADTGETFGPIPKEYVPPIIRVLITLVAVTTALIVAGYAATISFPELFSGWVLFSDIAILIATVVFNAGLLILIFGLIFYYESTQKRITEKTIFESILGLGQEGLDPKKRTDSVAEMFFGTVFGIILLLPAVQGTVVPTFAPLLNTIAILLLLSAVKGLLFFLYGENNLNLIYEAILSVGFIILVFYLVNYSWPFEYIWTFSDGTWQLISLEELREVAGTDFVLMPFAIGWTIFIFLLMADNTWKLLISGFKISFYLRQGKGIWWKGGWGTSYRRSFFERVFGRKSSRELTNGPSHDQ